MTALINLYSAILKLENTDEVKRFFADLCTPQEIDKLQERWRVAQIVAKNISYREISEVTGASTTTITRVARALSHGNNGYKILIDKLNK